MEKNFYDVEKNGYPFAFTEDSLGDYLASFVYYFKKFNRRINGIQTRFYTLKSDGVVSAGGDKFTPLFPDTYFVKGDSSIKDSDTNNANGDVYSSLF